MIRLVLHIKSTLAENILSSILRTQEDKKTSQIWNENQWRIIHKAHKALGLGAPDIWGPQLQTYVWLCVNFHLTATMLDFNIENFSSCLRRSQSNN